MSDQETAVSTTDTERDEPLPNGVDALIDLLTARTLEVTQLKREVTRLYAVVTAQAETIARLHDVGTGIVSHRYEGDCPVGPPFSPTKRDRNCPACRALDGGAA